MINEALLWTFLTSSSLFSAICGWHPDHREFIVPVGTGLLTQAGTIPLADPVEAHRALGHATELLVIPGISNGQISRISLKFFRRYLYRGVIDDGPCFCIEDNRPLCSFICRHFTGRIEAVPALVGEEIHFGLSSRHARVTESHQFKCSGRKISRVLVGSSLDRFRLQGF